MAHTVYIRGIPENKNIKNVAVREAPGLTQKERFRADIGLKATCSEVKPDLGNDGFNGQVYKWFFLTFEDGRNGWVRDDLLEVEGDLTAVGYAVYTTRTYAFTAVQQVTTIVVTTTATPPKSGEVTAPTTAPVITPQPKPQPQPQAQPQPAPAPSGYDVTINTKARVRSRPTTSGQQIGSFEPGTTIKAYALEPGQDGQAYRWARVLVNNLSGYVREDLLNFSPEAAKAFGIGIAAPVTSAVSQPVATAPSAHAASFQLQWPVRVHTINQNFMENRFFDYSQFGHPGHEGIDFPVGNGTEIFAAANGIVDLVDLRGTTPFEAAYGTHIWIRHDQPGGVVYRTLYAHLSQVWVSQGQQVTAGQLVALSGNTGRSTGPHLHFSLKKVGASNARETTYQVVGDLIKVPGTNVLWRRGDTGTFKWDYIDPTSFLTPPPANIPVKRV
jgi:murein DD-endopeptidase MepM/ murein hydrolase activator NlpD